jgi:hypothetical protein
MTAFLVVSTLAWIPYGLYCFAAPTALAEIAGVAATTPTGIVELRAMYGGAQTAIGALALGALLRPDLRRGVVLALGTITAGLALARFAGALAGGFSPYTLGGLAFEIGATLWAGLALRR